MEFRVQIVSKQVERRGEGGSHVYSRPGYLQRMSGVGRERTYNVHDVTYPTESKTSRGYLFVGHAPANEKEKEINVIAVWIVAFESSFQGNLRRL